MRFRKPELIPLLFIICATVVLMFLGIWQLERLEWKNALITSIAEAQAKDTLGSLPEDVSGLEYRKVILSGTYLNDKSLRLVGRKQGMASGFFVLTPFVLEDDGRVILVNRGFAETGKENPQPGLQRIIGILRPPREKRLFSPENQVDKNVWFHEDMAAIRTLTGTSPLPLIVEIIGKNTGQQPVPGNGEIYLRNDHLGYAITWLSLAVIGLIMFGIYHRVPENKA